jgi:hypothetical protein
MSQTTAWPVLLEDLWKGSMLGSIAHAIAVARFPDLESEQSWQKSSYSVQDGMGSRGTVCFELDDRRFPIRCIGAFLGFRSERRKLEHGIPRDPHVYLAGMTGSLLSTAERSFRYLLDEFNGQVLPWVTAAMWSEGGPLESQDAWETFRQHGGHLIERQVQPVEAALRQWEWAYKLSGEEASLLVSLYQARIADPRAVITLTPEDYSIIERNREGVEASRDCFSEIEIGFPRPE